MNEERLTAFDSAVLAVSSLAIVTSVFLGAAAGAGYQVLPQRSLCPSVLLFDLECAGCGLTRSFVLLGGGDIAGAFAMNPLGPLLFLALAVAAVVKLAKAFGPESINWRRLDVWLGAAVAAILVARLVHFYLLTRA